MTTVSTPVDVNAVFIVLKAWIKQKPGLDPRNYGYTREGERALRSELRSIAKDRKRALKALDEAKELTPAQPDLLADAFSAYSGRLQWMPTSVGTLHLNLEGSELKFGEKTTIGHGTPCVTPSHLTYTTGQYWPTEYRKAAAAVLERYIASWRRWWSQEHPQTFTYRTIEDVRAANRMVGGHWFDADTMRFFKTRIESGLVACDWVEATADTPAHPRRHRFVTSEKGPDGVRRYSVREALPDGSIATVGEFQGYRTLAAARAAILKHPEVKP